MNLQFVSVCLLRWNPALMWKVRLLHAAIVTEGFGFGNPDMLALSALQLALGGSPSVKYSSNLASSKIAKAASAATSQPFAVISICWILMFWFYFFRCNFVIRNCCYHCMVTALRCWVTKFSSHNWKIIQPNLLIFHPRRAPSTVRILTLDFSASKSLRTARTLERFWRPSCPLWHKQRKAGSTRRMSREQSKFSLHISYFHHWEFPH